MFQYLVLPLSGLMIPVSGAGTALLNARIARVEQHGNTTYVQLAEEPRVECLPPRYQEILAHYRHQTR